ncbi:hypothetical protein O6H91_12G072100 [Diphasiastrum complanatum]|uniref:Uncharacterized protein n=1 Tax=Diphasiastrum complanatum TaxID=34168 RepID=A0ACC2C379_DIPCM|nr:hypothetical protein O6H91_12G072100 [Diphasiastrum complanatum]
MQVVLGHQSEPIAEAVVQKVAASKRAHVFTTSSKDVQSSLNGYYIEKGMPFQMCSFVIDSKIEGLRVDLPNCKLRMVGPHQLDNATTAILTTLCLQRKGWQIRDTAIQRGLECTFLPGRFQLTTSVEARALGSCDAQVILDGEGKPAIIVTTEVSVAGSRLRSASKSFLLRTWTEAAKRHEMAISHHSEFLPKRGCKEDASLYDSGTVVERRDQEKQISTEALRADKYGKASLVLEEANSLLGAVKLASERLQLFRNLGQGIICVTGSLHAVSAANSIISDCAKHCC